MLTDLAKMATGLMARSGIGPFLRLAALGAMSAGVWLGGAPLWRWAAAADWEGLPGGTLGAACCVAASGALVAFLFAADERKWVPRDFLKRAPFVCWCLMTSDGDDVPLWAILLWPVMAASEVVISACLLVGTVGWGVWRVAAAIGRGAWRVLSIRPLERGH